MSLAVAVQEGAKNNAVIAKGMLKLSVGLVLEKEQNKQGLEKIREQNAVHHVLVGAQTNAQVVVTDLFPARPAVVMVK